MEEKRVIELMEANNEKLYKVIEEKIEANNEKLSVMMDEKIEANNEKISVMIDGKIKENNKILDKRFDQLEKKLLTTIFISKKSTVKKLMLCLKK